MFVRAGGPRTYGLPSAHNVPQSLQPCAMRLNCVTRESTPCQQLHFHIYTACDTEKQRESRVTTSDHDPIHHWLCEAKRMRRALDHLRWLIHDHTRYGDWAARGDCAVSECVRCLLRALLTAVSWTEGYEVSSDRVVLYHEQRG